MTPVKSRRARLHVTHGRQHVTGKAGLILAQERRMVSGLTVSLPVHPRVTISVAIVAVVSFVGVV